MMEGVKGFHVYFAFVFTVHILLSQYPDGSLDAKITQYLVSQSYGVSRSLMKVGYNYLSHR